MARYVRISPRKVKSVIDMVRGKSVAEAEAILTYSPRGASEVVGKLVKSAAANAENNMDIPRDSLYIAEIYADQGPTLKRYPAPRPGKSVSDPEAHQPHHGYPGSGKVGGIIWDRKSIPTVFGSA